jgi:hypothetical protein
MVWKTWDGRGRSVGLPNAYKSQSLRVLRFIRQIILQQRRHPANFKVIARDEDVLDIQYVYNHEGLPIRIKD